MLSRPTDINLRYNHFLFDPLHSAIAEANQLRHVVDTEAAQRQSRLINRVGIIQRATELLAIRHSAVQPGVNSRLDHGALKLSESASHLQHQLPTWRGRIDRLLIKIQINAAGL